MRCKRIMLKLVIWIRMFLARALAGNTKNQLKRFFTAIEQLFMQHRSAADM